MATLTQPFTFTPGTFAVASQVDANLTTLYGWVNGGSAIWADASRAFTSVPSGPSADPTAPNHLVRKSYVDFIANLDSGSRQTMRSGSSVVSPVTDGHADIAFPSLFPTSCSGIVAVNGDYSSTPGVIVGGVDNPTTSGFAVFVITSSTGAAWHSGNIRIDWLAWGF